MNPCLRQETRAIEHKLKAALLEWLVLERDFLPLPILGGRPTEPK